MKLRDLRNLPVYCRENRCYLARIDRGIVDGSFRLRYLVAKKPDMQEVWIAAEDFSLTEERAEIFCSSCMKSGLDGHTLSIYEKKCGDRVHDPKGGQVGNISDFILNPATGEITHLEVSRGHLADFLYGRLHIPLAHIRFENTRCAFIQSKEGEEDVLSAVSGYANGRSWQ